jgi:hypothetical protein
MEPPTTTNATSVTAKQVHDDIEQTLGVPGAPAAKSETQAEKLEARIKKGGAALWRTMKHHPFLSMAAIAVGGIVAASAVGAAEIWFGGVIAFAAYKVLREGEPPMRVLRELGREL